MILFPSQFAFCAAGGESYWAIPSMKKVRNIAASKQRKDYDSREVSATDLSPYYGVFQLRVQDANRSNGAFRCVLTANGSITFHGAGQRTSAFSAK